MSRPKATVRFCIAFLLLFSSVRADESLTDRQRYEHLRRETGAYGAAAIDVLQKAHQALEESHNTLAGIEDLWTAALKEGKPLLRNTDPWRATPAAMTGDMLGQTTVGPWQITLSTARKYYPGKLPALADSELLKILEQNPQTQALIAAGLLEDSYRTYGRRNPLAIQNYFWLDAFQKKLIGQGPWFANVLAKEPRDRIRTGFYAKQFLLGSRYNPQGLLYWLYVTGDETAIREALKEWKKAGYGIQEKDLLHCGCNPGFQKYLRQLLVLQ